MGCCGSVDVTPDAPEEILPDPVDGEPCTFTVKKAGSNMLVRGLARDYEVLKGTPQTDEEKKASRWLFLNKSGSKWGGQCTIALENYIRTKPDKPKEGEILWKADFKDDPYFQQV